MKAKVELDIDKEDLNYELKELIKDLAETEIKKLIQEQAKVLVIAEIDKILQPLVLKVLTGEKFDFNTGYHDYKDKYTLDDKLKKLTISYLNRPSYVYSKGERIPSERYRESSSGGEKTSLINHIINDEIRLFVDSEFTPKIRNMIKELIADRSKIEEILISQTRQLVLEKIK